MSANVDTHNKSNNINNHTDSSHNDSAHTMTSASQAAIVPKPSSTSLKQSSPLNQPPNQPKPQTSLFANLSWRLWAMLIGLAALSLWSSWVLIDQQWTLPLRDLLIPSSQLDIASMAIQLHIVATSVVALLAGGLLGVVSILLQQLVKNPLASDTTLGVGVGAQLAMLIVTLFLPSLAIYGGIYVAFVGAIISMGLVFALSAPSRFNPLILILAGLVVNILLAAVANVLVLFFC
ncbi:iron chelate uptake ABC transporter family permease subunit [Psychrobacter sp. JCM 18900]|uniref:iron chelate uptake ABC transporter family permease subunit n=1 Tax=Psychrobacter sp. JCM 18900 TaxID=1298608 RepID=UPI000434702F|nr:iron chelate uptake ABC transporter family permease subunit [Psychrobacter sp. JCM 18900]GAF53522.1 ferrichrome transport system permease protein FhuB [Psychrobacter sp. JCM 18900]